MATSPAHAASSAPQLGRFTFDPHADSFYNNSSLILMGTIVPFDGQPLPAVVYVTVEGTAATCPITVTPIGTMLIIPAVGIPGLTGTIVITVFAPDFKPITTTLEILAPDDGTLSIEEPAPETEPTSHVESSVLDDAEVN
jgi:hypothetical protein